MSLFSAASLLPALTLSLACLLGGLWPTLAVLSITLLVLGMDWIAPKGLEPCAGDGLALNVALGLVQLPLMGLCVWSLASGMQTPAGGLLLFIAAGLYFGQIGNSSAHELIHRKTRWINRLGVICYASVLHGHHASAHGLVHHVHVGTPKDPNTPRGRENFWRFLIRAWPGEYKAGRAAEMARRSRHARFSPFVFYAGLHLLALGGAAFIGGWTGLAVFCGIALYTQVQLFLCDYVQHFGLQRRVLPDGSYERVGPQHAWNAPHLLSSAMMLNAPRHSDHHMRPATPYPELELDPQRMPTMPYSLPTMALIATIPPLWQHVMAPCLAEWVDAPARDMGAEQRAVSEKLRTAGQPAPNLPKSPHDIAQPVDPSLPQFASMRRSADERG